ncbi:MAG: hypothetical protein ACE5F1_07505 [Planctomycetota bacterium]
MRNVLSSAIAVSVLASVVLAQVPPGLSRAPANSTIFTTGTGGNVPGATVQQISFQRLPGQAAGKWTACLTVTGLSTTWGGSGGSDLFIAELDRTTNPPTLKKTLEAKNLNGFGTEFGLMIDRTGKYAVFDRSSGVYFAHRTGPGVAFGTPVAVQGFGIIAPSFVDPSLGYVRDLATNTIKLTMFWVSNGKIVMNFLNITNLSAPKIDLTKSVVVVNPAKSGTPNSPTPADGPDGETEGLFTAEVAGSDNDMFWAEDLRATTPHTILIDTTNWINNGGFSGGMFHWADSGAPSYHVVDAQGAWLLGDDEKIGGQADVFGAAFKKGRTPLFMAIFMSGKTTTAPLTIPGINGKFGLDLTAGFQLLGSFNITGADERGATSFPIPPNTGFVGKSVSLQGLAIDPVNRVNTFTNTAFFYFRA